MNDPVTDSRLRLLADMRRNPHTPPVNAKAVCLNCGTEFFTLWPTPDVPDPSVSCPRCRYVHLTAGDIALAIPKPDDIEMKPMARRDMCTHPHCSGLIACHDCGRRYNRMPDAEHDGVKIQEGYLIRKALKPEHCKAGKLGEPFVDRGPDYLYPGEGYHTFKGCPPVHSVRMGWYTLAEAQEALAIAEDQAREHGYLDTFEKFEHTIVKITVIEEAPHGTGS